MEWDTNELLKISTEIKTAWITGRQSFQVEKRAKDMSIDYLVQNCTGKIVALEKILKENGFKTSEMAYMGDDIIDISILRAAGRSVCPMDTCKEVKKYVDYVSALSGEKGIVREIELIVKAKDKWKKSLDRYIST